MRKTTKGGKFPLIEVREAESVAINGLALELKRKGVAVHNLSAGEPMVKTPPSIIRAVTVALKAGHTHYPPSAGIMELRETAAKWMNEDFGARYRKEHTVVVTGGKFGIYLLLQAMINPGDEVIVISPYWVSYPSMVKIFKGKPKIIRTTRASGWKVRPEDVRRAVTKRTKLLLLNNGTNPTGALYTKGELRAILGASKRAGLFVISDEVYSGLTYGKPYISAASMREFKDMVAIIQSASKNFAMTGFRIGFVFAPERIANVLDKLLSQSTTGVATSSQYAALEAIKRRKKYTRVVRSTIKKRRDAFMRALMKEFGSRPDVPDSGLYAFVPLAAMGWKGRSSKKFCMDALAHARVASVPGSAFGEEGYVRFSFGESEDVIRAGLAALSRWLKK